MHQNEIHGKIWGFEEWIVNDMENGYCGKILTLLKSHQCSNHYHQEKHETFYINKGKVLFFKDENKILLKEGDKLIIPPQSKHYFIGITDCEIIEFSSFHKEEDSYRMTESRKVPCNEFCQILKELD